MPSSTIMDFNLHGIGTVLKHNYLSVPKYQRSFTWEKENVEDLLKDIHTAIRENQDEYFLSS